MRCIRRVKTVRLENGTEQQYVNLTMAEAEPVFMGFAPAPNVSSKALLAVIQNCAENNGGLLFARLHQIKHCPVYGIAVISDNGKTRNDQSTIFLQTRVLDFSGSTDVAITEKAALGLSN